MLKKIITASMLTALIGCTAVEQSYDSIKLEQVFDNEFAHTIEQRNTLEDNKALLKRIENDKELYSLLLKNKDKASANHKYYIEYMILKNKIEQDEFVKRKKEEAEILNQKGMLKDAKEELSKREQQKELNEIENEINVNKEITATVEDQIVSKKETTKTVEKVDVKKSTPQKEVKVTPKKVEKNIPKTTNEVKKNVVKAESAKVSVKDLKEVKTKKHTQAELDKTFYEVEEKIEHDLLIMQSHCNEEDAHLLIDDLNNLKDKVKNLTNKDEVKYEYIMDKYKSDIDSCLVFYKNNELLNPPAIEDK